MHFDCLEFTDSIVASTEEIVTALETAADSLHRDDLIKLLATAVANREHIDATIDGLIGRQHGGSDECLVQLEMSPVPGGYALTGFLGPRAGMPFWHVIEAVLKRPDPKRPGVAPPGAWPFSPTVAPTGPLASAGRNDPCPCGSGRKHKRCCRR